MESIKFLVFTALALALISETVALKCHQCTSQKEAECADSMWFEPEKDGGVRKIKTEKFLQDCPADGKNYTICRKIDQNVRGEERVIRSCGYVEHTKSDCYQTVLEEYNTFVCQCREDGCNGAESINMSFGLMTLTVALAAYFAH